MNHMFNNLSSDEKLVLAVLAGRVEAFDPLVARYQEMATRIAYRLLNHKDDAMEVTQDAFCNAFDRLGSLSEPARFKPWFLRIVNNLALNRRRNRARRKTLSLDHTPTDSETRIELHDKNMPTPRDLAIRRDLSNQLRSAIDALPEPQRQALILYSLEKLPQKEVAQILTCSVEMVKWNVFQARKTLRITLRDPHDTP
jgi:RNA polymerase sigma-70 factor (ECF subfamily)